MKQYIISILVFPIGIVAEELDLPEGFVANPAQPERAVGFNAVRRFHKEKIEIENRFRQRFADALVYGDRVEILLLNFDPIEPDDRPADKLDQYFPIQPYKMFSQILGRKMLKGEEAKKVVNAMAILLREPHSAGPLAHFPSFGLRVYIKDEIFFETSLSVHTGTYYIAYPDDFGSASWVGFNSVEFLEIVSEILPIPQSEVDRYKAKYE